VNQVVAAVHVVRGKLQEPNGILVVDIAAAMLAAPAILRVGTGVHAGHVLSVVIVYLSMKNGRSLTVCFG
jgi:hypothetical protein